MNLNKSGQEILDRYLLAVRRALPGKQREDITEEIRSHILDMLEERYAQEDEITKSQVSTVLEEMGSPRKVAAQFGPQRSLISARLFPSYLLVLKIVVAAVSGALAISFVITTIIGGVPFTGKLLLEFLGSLWSGALSGAAFTTLTFAIIDCATTGKEIEELKDFEKFEINDLPELAEEKKDPSVAGTVFEIVMGVIGMAFMTFIANNDGAIIFMKNPQSSVQMLQIFTENFLRFVPVLVAAAGLEVARLSLLLAQGRRTSLSNWWKICLKTASIVYTSLMLKAFPIITLAGVQALPNAPDFGYAGIANGVNIGLRVLMILSIFGDVVEIIRGIYREITDPAGV